MARSRDRKPLLRLFGFPIYVEPSWFVIAALITWSLATGMFPADHPDAAPVTLWVMGASGAVLLFVSVLLHELGHSLVARRFDLEIRGITLWLFGGVAEMADEPPSAKSELLIAIAGPIVSFALGAAFWGLAPLLRMLGLVEVATVSGYLGDVNVILAVFNLLPAFPLDGGRVARAALWAKNDDLLASTRVTAKIGAGFGAAFIGVGVLMAITGNLFGGLWLGLIGLFLRGAAKGSYNALVTRRWLADTPVARFMTKDPVTVPTTLPVPELVERHIYTSHHRLYPVVDDGRLQGCVLTRDVAALPRDAWARHTVGDVMRPVSPATVIDAATSANEALRRMNEGDQARLAVADDGALVGVLSLKDLLDYLAVRSELEHGAPPPPGP